MFGNQAGDIFVFCAVTFNDNLYIGAICEHLVSHFYNWNKKTVNNQKVQLL